MPRLPVACVALALLAAPAAAQQQHMNMPMKGMPGMNMDETKSSAAYRPGLGDLMTTLVQPHHIKLGLAGAGQNWPLAAYELDELQETFDTVGKLIVKHGNLQIAPTIAATVTPAMDPLEKSIAAKDGAAFTKAYAALTDACNACHRSADHAMIVIKVPDSAGAAFPDQAFAPAK